MITLTIIEKKKNKNIVEFKRSLRLFHSMDLAKKFIIPVVKEMKVAKREKREPDIKIDAVSYDTKSEKTLLLELKAITSVENEDDGDY